MRRDGGGAKDPGAASPPPMGPFVLPKDRPPRAKKTTKSSDGSASAAPPFNPCGWMCRLCTRAEAPAWAVHNPYVENGYRVTGGFRGAIRSVLMWHNETANIWSHLLGLVVFALLTTSMATGWGNAHAPALPASWIMGEEGESWDGAGGEALRATVEVRACRRGVAHRASRASARGFRRVRRRTRRRTRLFFFRGGPRRSRRSFAVPRRSLAHPPRPLRRRPQASHATLADVASELFAANDLCVPGADHCVAGDWGHDRDDGGDGDGGGESVSGGARVHRHVSFLHLDGAANALRDVASTLRAHLHAPPAPQTTGPDAGGRPTARELLASETSDALRARLEEAKSVLANSAHVIEAKTRELASRLETQIASLASTLDAASSEEAVLLHYEPAPRWPMYVFLAGACACLSFSGICHTLACVSAQVSSIVWRIDYVGIVTLIMASFYPVVYYSFMCVPALRTFYLVGISLFGFVVLSVMLLERFQAPKYTPFRAVLFSGLGAFGIFPLLHQTLFTWRIVPTPMVVTFWLEILMGMCYLGGAFIYARAVPERWNPGRFDVWGGTLCSHNLFHVLVVAGAYVHYRAALVLIAWRDHHRCDADATLLRTFYLDNGWLGGRHHVPWIPHGEL